MLTRLFPSLRSLAYATLCLCCLSACGDDTDDLTGNPTEGQAPTLEIRLTDDPGDYDEVVVDIQDIRVKFAGEDYRDLDDHYVGTIDLLTLTGGVDTLVATSVVPDGELEEVRLILGDDNYLRIDDQVIPLRTPSAQQSGLKVKFRDAPELLPGAAYTVLLDFDAGRSVVRAGNSGNYNLKPVIRASIERVDVDPTLGRLQGLVTPVQAQYVTLIKICQLLPQSI